MALIKQEADGHVVTSTYKDGEEITIRTEIFDGCDDFETITEIKYIDRDECVYNIYGSKYKECLKAYKSHPKEIREMFGFGNAQMSYCYECDYCKMWGKSQEEEKEIKKAWLKHLEEECNY